MKKITDHLQTFHLAILLAANIFFLACAGQQLEVKPISKSENPQELINQLDNDIALAYKSQFNVLAPTWFGRANSSLNAAKKGLEGLPRESLPSLRKTLMGGWQYLLPFALLLFFLGILRYSAQTAIIYTLAALILVSSFKKESRLTPKNYSMPWRIQAGQ